MAESRTRKYVLNEGAKHYERIGTSNRVRLVPAGTVLELTKEKAAAMIGQIRPYAPDEVEKVAEVKAPPPPSKGKAKESVESKESEFKKVATDGGFNVYQGDQKLNGEPLSEKDADELLTELEK
jgi:hypothetical protein